MHWLPLVAMVIASALPFPPNPLPRLVVAATDSSQNFDNRRLDNISFTAAGSSTPAQVPVHYNSHGNVSQKNFSAAARKEGEASQHKAVDHLQSTVEDVSSVSRKRQRDQITKGKLSQKPLKPKHALSDIDPADSKQDRSNGKGIRQQDSGDYKKNGLQPSQADSSHRDDHTSLDSKPELKQFGSQERTGPSLDTLHSSQTGLLGAERADGSTQNGELLGGDYTLEPSEGEPLPGSHTRGSTLEQRGATEENRVREDVKGDAGETRGAGLGTGLGDGGLLADEDLLFLDSHPRVLFSSSPLPPKHPPLLLMLERDLLAGSEGGEDGDWEDEEEEGTPADTRRPPRRRRRSASSTSSYSSRSRLMQHGPELSMCAERSDWVMDKRTAVDIHHNTVTIVPEIPTLSGHIKQFFYETSCREDHVSRSHGTNGAGPGEQAGGGCVGVDKRQWNSSCQTKQSFVRALTGDAKRRRWSWIRVNSSCVCVLSRVNKTKPMRIEGKR